MNDLTKILLALGYPVEEINKLEKETYCNCGLTLRFDKNGNLLCCKGENNISYLKSEE